MKKKLLYFISAAFVLCAAVLPLNVLASEDAETQTITADTTNLREGTYVLDGDVTLSNALRIEAGADVTIDLKDYTLTLPQTISTVIEEGAQLTICNGTVRAKNLPNGTYALFNIKKDSSISLNAVTLDTNGAALFPQGDAASVTVSNSTIKGGVYAVGTNAAASDNYNVRITLENSTLEAPYGRHRCWRSQQWKRL